TMKTTLLATAIVFMTITQALAGPCGFEEKGRLVITGYAIGATAVPAEQKARLTEFAKTAKHRFGICIFAQVDATGSEEANKKVAQARADGVRKFLASQGVANDVMVIMKQEKAFTLFGLLSDDQANDRRVVVTHD
ncbi:MAG: OmpA family protein, partial [Alphaproteobacteria bacterium]